MLAKKAKEYYVGGECLLVHEMVERCFTEPLVNPSDSQAELLIRFMDLLTTLLSTTSSDERRYLLVYLIQDKQILTKCKLAQTLPQYRDALNKRCDELRHYINVQQEDTPDSTVSTTQTDQAFYTRLQSFTKLVYAHSKETYTQLTSQ